jgi:hypothetical protein
VFEEAKFQLHKWHSNDLQLESADEERSRDDNSQPSYAKQQLGFQNNETKLLGLPWNKSDNTFSVNFPKKPVDTTRREILRFLASKLTR